MNVVERQALRVGRECWKGGFRDEDLDQWWLMSRGGRDGKQERVRLDEGAENSRAGANGRTGASGYFTGGARVLAFFRLRMEQQGKKVGKLRNLRYPLSLAPIPRWQKLTGFLETWRDK